MKLILLMTFLMIFPNRGHSKNNYIKDKLISRGLVAVERISKLAKKKSTDLSPKEKCEWAFENIYYAFAHPELSKVFIKPVYQKLESESTAYVFVISENSSEMGFQMNFIYQSKKSNSPVISEISTLKSGWVFKISEKIPKTIFVNSPNCFYQFNLNNPLDSTFDIIKSD